MSCVKKKKEKKRVRNYVSNFQLNNLGFSWKLQTIYLI